MFDKVVLPTIWFTKKENSDNLLNMYDTYGIDQFRINAAKSIGFDNMWVECVDVVREYFLKKRNKKVNFVLDIPIPGDKVRIKKSTISEICENEELIITANKNYLGQYKNVLYIQSEIFIQKAVEGSIITVGEVEPRFLLERKEDNCLLLKCIKGGNIPFCKYLVTDNIKFFQFSDRERWNYYQYLVEKLEPSFLALSFVQSPQEITNIRKNLIGNKDIKIISKIESEEGVTNLEDIIENSEKIMIARGDLLHTVGVGRYAKYVYYIQKICDMKNIPYYVATGILETVVEAGDMPLRSEILDVYNILNSRAEGIVLENSKVKDEKLFRYIMECMYDIYCQH